MIAAELIAWGAARPLLTDYRIEVAGTTIACAQTPEWGRAYLKATGRGGIVAKASHQRLTR